MKIVDDDKITLQKSRIWKGKNNITKSRSNVLNSITKSRSNVLNRLCKLLDFSINFS